MGRPPKPVEQKRALGNPGKRALPKEGEVQVLPASSGVPEPHRPLGDAGLQLWERIWSAGIQWISPQTDVELLLMTCESLDEREQLREIVMASGESKDRRALRLLNGEITSNLSMLGFSPVDRARLGVAEVTRRSKLEELMAKHG